jgi:hypothetical protein
VDQITFRREVMKRKLKSTTIALGLTLLGQAEPTGYTSFKDDLLTGRAVQTSLTGTSQFLLPRGKFFVTQIFCNFTASTFIVGQGVRSIPLSIESTDPKITLNNFKVEIPFDLTEQTQHTSAGYGLGTFFYTPETPLFINNLSGKMRLKAQVEEASDTAMEPPACNVVVIAYRS